MYRAHAHKVHTRTHGLRLVYCSVLIRPPQASFIQGGKKAPMVSVYHGAGGGGSMSKEARGFWRKWFIREWTNGTRRAGTHHTAAVKKPTRRKVPGRASAKGLRARTLQLSRDHDADAVHRSSLR